jgi:hypothetical protein
MGTPRNRIHIIRTLMLLIPWLASAALGRNKKELGNSQYLTTCDLAYGIRLLRPSPGERSFGNNPPILRPDKQPFTIAKAFMETLVSIINLHREGIELTLNQTIADGPGT